MSGTRDHAVELTEEDVALFNGPNFAHVSTLGGDGWPQATVVWVDAGEGMVRFNSAEHSRKVRNLKRDPRIAISVHGQENPYLAVTVIGTAALTSEGAEEHIDELTRKYTDMDRYPAEWRKAGERRVKITVEPKAILRYGY
jgi:PPOX class probable F420-dependent enzyme